MWHHFITLPLVTRILGLLSVVGLAALGWLKRKAIATAGSTLTNTASERFWGYLRSKLQVQSAAPTHSTLRTYRGTFYGYSQYALYPHEYFFTLVADGITTKVPVMRTNLLSSVRQGDFVEIDTQVGFARGVEVVLRVHHHGNAGTKS